MQWMWLLPVPESWPENKHLMTLTLRLAIIFTLLFPLLTSCQPIDVQHGTFDAKKPSVVTTLFPLYDFARAICGNRANVTLLLPPGVEAHNFEPKPADMITISKAAVFIYTNPVMEPWATRLLKGVGSTSLKAVDASIGTRTLPAKTGHGERHGHLADGNETGIDPHIWLDFSNAQIIVDNMADAMMEKDPANAVFYKTNAAVYKAELAKLDTDFSVGLKNCGTRSFIHGGHFAFGYLAHRYTLSYRSAQAINPDAEPTPGTIAELLDLVKRNNIHYVYAEEIASPRTSEMIAKEAGVKILMLHGAHNISRGDLEGGVTFIGLMRKNLENLRLGMACK